MKYTIYKTTNLLDGKIYIGKHICNCKSCKYMGSGKLIIRDIKKYGIENFKKEILFQFKTEEEMNLKEAELVNEEFIELDYTYNICPGGKGGWGHVNFICRNDLDWYRKYVKKLSFSLKKGYANGSTKGFKNKKHSKEVKEKISKSENLVKRKKELNPFFGNHHTEETKIKMRRPKNIGNQNSQFGTMWITNGSENKKIKKEDLIPEGWHKGRVI